MKRSISQVFIEAVQNNNESDIYKSFKPLNKEVINFLKSYCNASLQDAKDCSQEAFYKTVLSIRKDEIRDHNKIAPYLNRAALNNYIKFIKKQKRFHLVPRSEKNYFAETPPKHHYNLIEEEFFKHFILSLQTLPLKHRECIQYWLTHSDAKACDVASHFEISLSNGYTRKSRARQMVKDEITKYCSINSLDAEFKKRLYNRLPEKYRSYLQEKQS